MVDRVLEAMTDGEGHGTVWNRPRGVGRRAQRSEISGAERRVHQSELIDVSHSAIQPTLGRGLTDLCFSCGPE